MASTPSSFPPGTGITSSAAIPFSDLAKVLDTIPAKPYTPELLCSIQEIRDAQAMYFICLDSQDLDRLSLAFTKDAKANLGGPNDGLQSLAEIKTAIKRTIDQVATQHSRTTDIVKIYEVDGQDFAFSITYLRAEHWGVNKKGYENDVVSVFGMYQDWWRKVDGRWRIWTKNLVSMGPHTGNTGLFGISDWDQTEVKA